MTQVLITETYLEDIADAIRGKSGSESTYTPAQMATAIENLPSGEEPDLVTKAIVANGTYAAEDEGHDGYSQVAVQVPNSYAAGDEGKVVSSGALVSQTSTTKSANGTYDTTLNNEVVVDVPNTYTAADEGKVVDSGELVTQGSLEITQNGTFDTTLISEVVANVEDEELRQMVYNVYPTEEVQGNPATFTDGAEGIPVKDLKVNVAPNQDLHGYDKPWAGGAGKNLLPLTVENIKALNPSYTWSGNTATKNNVSFAVETDSAGNVVDIKVTASTAASSNTEFDLGKIIRETDTDYFISGCPSGGSASTYRVIVRSYNGSTGVQTESETGNGKSMPSTSSPTADNFTVGIWIASGQTANHVFLPMVEVGSSKTTFAPYENICPITGMTEVEVENASTNKAKFGTVPSAQAANFSYQKNEANDIKCTKVTSSSAFFAVFEVNVKTAGTYRLSTSSNTADVKAYGYINSLSGTSVFSNATLNSTVSLPVGTIAIGLYAGAIVTQGSSISVVDFRVNEGTDSLPYEPYNQQELSIPLGRTVYGGTLDVTTGVLTVDRGFATLTANNVSSVSGNSKRFNLNISDAKPSSDTVTSDKLSSNLFTAKSSSDTYYGVAGVSINSDGVVNISLGYNVTLENAKQFVTDNTTQICYPLATPATYQLTPQELLSVLGTNHISTDAESVDVEYRADIQLYIEQLTKPEEDDLIANQAIAAGTFFMIGNRLFLSTASIANGATITPGTNATELSLSDALNSLA